MFSLSYIYHNHRDFVWLAVLDALNTHASITLNIIVKDYIRFLYLAPRKLSSWKQRNKHAFDQHVTRNIMHRHPSGFQLHVIELFNSKQFKDAFMNENDDNLDASETGIAMSLVDALQKWADIPFAGTIMSGARPTTASLSRVS